MSQNIIKFTDGQRCADGRAQGQSARATVVGYAVLNTERKQMPSCDMGEEDNSSPATIWLAEKIGQSARHTDMNHPATKKGHTENKNLCRDVSIMHESFDASFTRSSG